MTGAGLIIGLVWWVYVVLIVVLALAVLGSLWLAEGRWPWE